MITNPKILIVDDMQDNLQVMLNCLFSGGYLNILCARNGTDALNIVHKELPDLVILDWDMPVMNGIEVLNSLRADPETQLIPVIIATGAMLDTKDLEEALNSGAIDYIRKPYESIELLARAKSALDFSSMLITIQTQKQQIEKQHAILKENEKRLKAFLNASNEACVFVEKDIIIEANRLFYDFTGFIQEEVIQHSFYNFFSPEFRKELTEIENMDRKIMSVALLTRAGDCLPVEMIIKQFEYNNRTVQAISFINLNQYSHLFEDDRVAELMVQKRKSGEMQEEIRELTREKDNLHHQMQFITLQSASCNEFVLELLNDLDELTKSISAEKDTFHAKVLDCIQKIKQHPNLLAWREFKLRFAEIHTGFYDRLIGRYPTLTETDLRLCALIKLKMSTKEIAMTLNHPVNSVKVARNRLRSKLQLDDSSESLLNLLANY